MIRRREPSIKDTGVFNMIMKMGAFLFFFDTLETETFREGYTERCSWCSASHKVAKTRSFTVRPRGDQVGARSPVRRVRRHRRYSGS